MTTEKGFSLINKDDDGEKCRAEIFAMWNEFSRDEKRSTFLTFLSFSLCRLKSHILYPVKNRWMTEKEIGHNNNGWRFISNPFLSFTSWKRKFQLSMACTVAFAKRQLVCYFVAWMKRVSTLKIERKETRYSTQKRIQLQEKLLGKRWTRGSFLAWWVVKSRGDVDKSINDDDLMAK